jgi:murein L,D-transpeptidase YcbB/YkuD
MTPTLRDPKAVMTEIAAADAPDAYLRSLHPKHEQFQLLHQALVKARAESEAGAKPANTQKIIVNMERWRWMPENLSSLYVWLNIPSYIVHVVKDGKTIYTDKIVVGELKYATPVFSADLKSIVFNPEWTVPSHYRPGKSPAEFARRRWLVQPQHCDPRPARAQGQI